MTYGDFMAFGFALLFIGYAVDDNVLWRVGVVIVGWCIGHFVVRAISFVLQEKRS
jgi:hypothetical protein